MKSERRIVITGMGALSPIGNDLQTIWQNLEKGQSGIGKIPNFDTTDYPIDINGSIKDFNPEPHLNKKEARILDPFIQYGVVAAADAIADSGIEVTDENRHRIGTIIGAGIGGLESIEAYHHILETKGPRRVSPFFTPGSITNMIAIKR